MQQPCVSEAKMLLPCFCSYQTRLRLHPISRNGTSVWKRSGRIHLDNPWATNDAIKMNWFFDKGRSPQSFLQIWLGFGSALIQDLCS